MRLPSAPVVWYAALLLFWLPLLAPHLHLAT